MPTYQAPTGKIYYRLEGTPGLPVLALIHPIGADHSLWDQVVPLLLPTHQVLRMDLRGHGGSDVADGDRTLLQFVDEFIALCSSLNISNLHLCGISLGGFVAASVAQRNPDLVSSLTLCSTAVKLPPPPGGWDERASAVRAQGMGFLVEGMVQRMISPSHQKSPVVDTLKTVFLYTKPEGYASACAVLRDADLEKVLPAVCAPTLVITGEQDALMPPGTGVAMVSLLKHGKHVSLPSGHFPPLENSDAFAKHLMSWSLQASNN